MIYLVDTNVLLGFSYWTDPRYPIVRPAVRELLTKGHQHTPEEIIAVDPATV